MDTKTDMIRQPVAVVGTGNTVTAHVLRQLIDCPVVELTPCRAAMGCDNGQCYDAVVVENFDVSSGGGLSPCAAARWALSCRSRITVVGLDNQEGRRFASQTKTPVFAYSDGRPQADLAAKNVRLHEDGLEFEALTRRDLLRVRVPLVYGVRLYDYLAALAGALALGMPLSEAGVRIAGVQ